jgi:hypothetical protein
VAATRNFTLSREGQVTDRYTKAIEQLDANNDGYPDISLQWISPIWLCGRVRAPHI